MSEEKKFNEPIILELDGYVKPVVKESRAEDWVLYGQNNYFWDYILDRYNGSPTNSSIIDAYIDRCLGKGLSIINASNNAGEYLKVLSVLSPRETRKLVSDYILFGSVVGQVRYSKVGRKIAKIEILERKCVAPAKRNKKGEIDKYWFCQDWSKKNEFEPEPFPAFGTSNKNIEIFEIRPYKAGRDYYADPAYLSGLQYARLEEEIANFSINHIMNGLSAGFIINFNEGEPSEELKEIIERMFKMKLTGSRNAGKFILSFNNSKETAPHIEAIPSNTSHEEWQLWTNIAREQIMVAHRVTSPMLFGIKDNTGLGNNANEMREATEILHETVTRPKQNEILEVLQEILYVNDISSPLTFIPLEDKEEKEEKVKEMDDMNPAAKERQLEVEAKIQLENHNHLSKKADELIACGEEIGDDWECVLEQEVDYEMEHQYDTILELTSTGTAIPNARSEQDSEKFKIRYKYDGNRFPQREFCVKMMAANKVYRKEDIIRMGGQAVNPGFGPNGANNYSIWLYKGGPNCSHKWLRRTYVKKGRANDVDVKSPLAEVISTAEARRRGDRTRNEKEVSMKPRDMPNNGYLPK